MSLDIPPALGSAQVEADGKAGSPGVGRDLFKIVLLGIAKFSAAFILIFLLTDMDPALRMPDSSAEDQRYVREMAGYYGSTEDRLVNWLADVARGNFGFSMNSQRPVADELGFALQATGLMVLATFALLILASACLTLVYRRASVSLPRAISLFGTLPGSIPEIVGVIIVWLVMGVFLGWIPLSMEPLGGDPFFYAVQAGGVAAILTLYKLGQVSSLSNFRADFDAGIARTLFDAFTDVLKYFPAWLFSAIILVEVVFHGVGLGGKFVSAVLTLDWMVVRAIAMLAVLAVIVVQIIADISSCLVEQPGEIHGHGPQSTIGAAIFSSSIALFGAGLVLAWFMAAVAAGAISSHDPYEINFGVVLSPPNGEFLFGTDQFGRDIFSRILFGARSIMVVPASAFFIALVVAAGLNLIPGTAKVLISFLASILASFPLLILAILIVAAFGAGHIVGYVGALAIGLLPALYQMIGQTLTEPPEGISTIKHCLQSIGTQSSALVAEGCRHLAYLVGIIFAVDYIGFGIQNPMASWGAMVGTGNLFEQGLLAPWTILAPFAAVVTLTLGLNLLAEGITRKLAKDWS